MGDKTAISYADATWNPCVGCSILSPGCTNCYAMKKAYKLANDGVDRYKGLTEVVNDNIVWNGVVRMDKSFLDKPKRWTRPRMIFVNSMSDLFHEDFAKDDIFAVIDTMIDANIHRYMVLTKRTEIMADLVAEYCESRNITMPDHIAWGTTVEDMTRAELRVPVLASMNVPVKFISSEPLIGAIDFSVLPKIDWIIVGGESVEWDNTVTVARPFDVAWAENIASYCADNDVAFHFKQTGSNGNVETTHYKGANFDEFPDALKIRDYPKAWKGF